MTTPCRIAAMDSATGEVSTIDCTLPTFDGPSLLAAFMAVCDDAAAITCGEVTPSTGARLSAWVPCSGELTTDTTGRVASFIIEYDDAYLGHVMVPGIAYLDFI